MSVESVLPLSDFANFLITVLVFFIVVRSRWVVDIIPILWYFFYSTILLALLSSTTLSLLTSKEVIDIVISSPIGEGRFGKKWL